VAKGKPEIDSERCKGCELCIQACPEHILALSAEFNKQGQPYPVCVEPDKCTACMSCAIMCPDAVIKIWRFQG
jgi:2-oxoglutarate ferredoxin oxidoreductase subunit delta